MTERIIFGPDDTIEAHGPESVRALAPHIAIILARGKPPSPRGHDEVPGAPFARNVAASLAASFVWHLGRLVLIAAIGVPPGSTPVF